jgi:type IV fimbrial biogenesis protein FimT
MVELMTVIAIVAILAAIAVPSFREYFEKSRVRGAADSVASLVALARAESVRRDRQVSIAFGGTTGAWCVGADSADDPDAATGELIPAASACDCTLAAGNASECRIGDRRSVVASDEFSGVSVNSVAPTFVFSGRSGALSDLTERTVTLSGPGNRFQLQVTVSPLGHSRACLPSGAGVIVGYPGC